MTSAVTIKEIPLGTSFINEFIHFAWKVYKDDSYWVPPLIADQKKLLNPKKNPFFEHSEAHAFAAYQNNLMTGRMVVGINHNSNQFRNEKVAFFGFFESFNDPQVSQALFDTAVSWSKEKKMDILRGPFNLTINDECGLLIDGFESDPYIMMTHNPSYYPHLLEKAGFTPAMDAYSFYLNTKASLTPELLQLCEYIEKTYKPTIRPVNLKKKFLEDAHMAMGMINSSLAENWGAVPMTRKEIEFKAQDLKHALVSDLCFFIEIDKKTVGFSLTLPNFNEAIKKANGRLFPFGLFKILYYSRKIKTARTIQLGLTKEYQKTGLGAYCYAQIAQRAAKTGIHEGEMSWILANNKRMVNGAELLGGKRYKTYRWYEKRIV